MIARTAVLTLLAAAGVALAQTTHTVQLQSVTFVPSSVTIRTGDTVQWVWVAGFHNVESGTVDTEGQTHADGLFSSGTPGFGPSFEWTFDAAFVGGRRTFPYYCVVHAGVGMTGVVSVVDCGSDFDCADADPCTDDLCSAGACGHPFNSVACDDGDVCTGNDRCANGLCAGTALPNCCRTGADCDDGAPCTEGLCEAGVCRVVLVSGSACDDGNPCTIQDACIQGACRGTPTADCCSGDANCDDDNGCTDDRCRAGACEHLFNHSPCDDGDPCTGDDACADGVCLGEALAGCCQTAGDCPAEPCQTARCIAQACDWEPIDGCQPCDSAAECEDSDPCIDPRCVGGACSNVFNSAECDDGDACTEKDRCVLGVCIGEPIDECCTADTDCEDDDPCTEDGCVQGQCRFLPLLNCDPPVTDNGGEEPGHGGDHPGDDDDPIVGPVPRLCGILGWLPMLLAVLTGRLLRAYTGTRWRDPC